MTVPVATRMPPRSWYRTGRPYRREARATDLVAEAAAAHPDRPALVAGPDRVVTHRELDRWSNRVANLLLELGVGRGDMVAVLARHVPETIAAVLGIVKAGAAYVPIDPEWPTRRVAQILRQLRVGCLFAVRRDLAAVFELQWQVPSLGNVVHLDEPGPAVGPEPLDEAAVRDLWDSVAAASDPAEAAGFNLQPLEAYSEADVRAYQRHVAALVRACRPRRVLEVGVGSGLLFRALADDVDLYVGLDPAPAAVEANRRWAARRGLLADLVEGFAHELQAKVATQVDLALLASTVQYFPGPRYLAAVLDQLVALVRPGGVVVVADVIDPASGQFEGGLRLPPRFFSDLAAGGPAWAAAEIRTREAADLPAELRARYDVLLHRATRSGRRADGSRGRPAPSGPRTWTGHHVQAAAATPPAVRAGAEDVCYVIFTSGSTGVPKGVVIRHRGVVNLVDWVNRTQRVTPEDRSLQVVSFCFDLSVYDIFGILSAGASLRLVPDEQLGEPEALLDVLEREPVTIWNSAPAAMQWLLAPAANRPPRGRDRLRLVFLSGDWIPLSMPDELRQAFPKVRIVNYGGATEGTVWDNYFVIDKVDPTWPSIPYGKPIQNMRYYVLDERLREVPVGVVGDLYLAGDGLAAGYANDPELTARKFVPDTVAGEPGELMYACGDRGRWLPDGNLQLLGRVDHQVKVRGYRIELGEIETVIGAHERVRVAVAVATGPREERRLTAFYVPRDPAPSPAELRRFVAAHLPDYMVPAALVPLDRLPLTANGKVDRRELERRAPVVDAPAPRSWGG